MRAQKFKIRAEQTVVRLVMVKTNNKRKKVNTSLWPHPHSKTEKNRNIRSLFFTALRRGGVYLGLGVCFLCIRRSSQLLVKLNPKNDSWYGLDQGKFMSEGYAKQLGHFLIFWIIQCLWGKLDFGRIASLDAECPDHRTSNQSIIKVQYLLIIVTTVGLGEAKDIEAYWDFVLGKRKRLVLVIGALCKWRFALVLISVERGKD